MPHNLDNNVRRNINTHIREFVTLLALGRIISQVRFINSQEVDRLRSSRRCLGGHALASRRDLGGRALLAPRASTAARSSHRGTDGRTLLGGRGPRQQRAPRAAGLDSSALSSSRRNPPARQHGRARVPSPHRNPPVRLASPPLTPARRARRAPFSRGRGGATAVAPRPTTTWRSRGDGRPLSAPRV